MTEIGKANYILGSKDDSYFGFDSGVFCIEPGGALSFMNVSSPV